MSDAKSNKKTLFSSMIWKLMERASVQIITLITQIILARIIAPEKFGSLSLIVVFYNIADLLVQKGFGISLIRKKAISQEDIDSVTFVSCIVAGIAFIVIQLLAPFVGYIYNDNSLVNPLRLLSVNLLISPIYCVYNSILIRNMKFKVIFYRGLAASIISGIIGVSLAALGYEIWALVAQMIANQIVITLMMVKSEKISLHFKFRKDSFKEVFSFGKNVLVTELLLTLVENLRTLFIGRFYSKSDLAYYDRGQLYPATLMRAIYDTLFSILIPHFSKFQDKNKEIASQYTYLTYISCVIIMPIFVGLASVSEEVILILLTDKWKFAIVYMQIFCLYQAVFPYQIVAKAVLYAVGNSERVLKLEIIKAIFSLTLMIISLYLGVLYVAISLIIVRLFSDTLYILSVEKAIGKNKAVINTWKPILATIIMFIVVKIAEVANFTVYLLLLVKLLCGVVAYTLIISILDRQLLSLIIKKFRRAE